MAVKRGVRSRRGFSLLDAAAGIYLLVSVVLIFAACYPTAQRTSRMNGSYSQAVSAVQHKIDQLRAVGYGRLTSGELRNAGIIDAPVAGQPFHFEGVDNLSAGLWAPAGTVTIASAGPNTRLVTVRLEWQSDPRGQRSFHEVQALIANE